MICDNTISAGFNFMLGKFLFDAVIFFVVISCAVGFWPLVNFASRRPTKKPEKKADKTIAAEEKITAGERWVFIHDVDPFFPKRVCIVTILEVNCGWVRYDMGGMFNDSRKSIKDFTSIYKKVSV